MSKVALVEIFKSVQGEGYHTGRPAIFVRTAGCNLACVFAEGSVCDTPYQHANLKLTVEEVIAEAITLSGNAPRPAPFGDVRRSGWEEHRPMLILTGGEPTLTPLFDELVDAALAAGFYVAVETNGTTWRDGLQKLDWTCVSPKVDVAQGSQAPYHNPNPQCPALHAAVVRHLEALAHLPKGEYRHVVSGPEAHKPPYREAFRHYLSPAVNSDGLGTEWKSGKFPGFVPGAVERCQEICWDDPRWRISIQTHKLLGVR